MSQSGGKGKVRDRDDIWKYFVWRGHLKPFDYYISYRKIIVKEKMKIWGTLLYRFGQKKKEPAKKTNQE